MFPSKSPIYLTTQTASFTTILLSWQAGQQAAYLGTGFKTAQQNANVHLLQFSAVESESHVFEWVNEYYVFKDEERRELCLQWKYTGIS